VITWTRLEGRIAGRAFAIQLDGDKWELLIDGHCRGRFPNPTAVCDLETVLEVIMFLHPPEHPHPGVDAAAARDDIHLTGRLDGSTMEEG